MNNMGKKEKRMRKKIENGRETKGDYHARAGGRDLRGGCAGGCADDEESSRSFCGCCVKTEHG